MAGCAENVPGLSMVPKLWVRGLHRGEEVNLFPQVFCGVVALKRASVNFLLAVGERAMQRPR